MFLLNGESQEQDSGFLRLQNTSHGLMAKIKHSGAQGYVWISFLRVIV